MKIGSFILFLAFALAACTQSSTESLVPNPDPKLIDRRSFESYRGFSYEGGYRKAVVLTCLSDGASASMEIWFQEADSSTALMEWSAKSGNVGVESLGPGIEKVVLRDVRYEKSIGAEGSVFPASPLELRLTRIGDDTLRLEILSPSGMPAPLPLQGGSMLLKKDIYVE